MDLVYYISNIILEIIIINSNNCFIHFVLKYQCYTYGKI